MIDPERIGASLADQTQGPLPTGLGADGLAVRHQRRVRRRRAAGSMAFVAIVAGGAFVLPLGGSDGDESDLIVANDAPPTTEDPVKVEEQATGSEAQDRALEDGEITDDEYEDAVAEFRACVERVDEENCYDYHLDLIEEALDAADGQAPTVTAPGTELVESILVPTGVWTVTEASTHLVAGDESRLVDGRGSLIALATTVDGPSGPILRISRDYGQPIDTPDGIVELDTPGQAIVFVNRIDGHDIAVAGLGVEAEIVEAVAGAITVVDGLIMPPASWPEAFSPIAPDAGPIVQELIITEGPGDLSVVVLDGSTRHAQDAIAGTRARSTTERVTEVALVTDTITFVAHEDRLYLLYTDPETADAAVGMLAPIEVEVLRTELELPSRSEVYDRWFAETPLPDDHGLDLLRDGLTIDPNWEAISVHALFQCAWIDRWVETGDPVDLEPLASRTEWPTATFVSALPEDEQHLVDIAATLLGGGETPAERADDPAAQRCEGVG